MERAFGQRGPARGGSRRDSRAGQRRRNSAWKLLGRSGRSNSFCPKAVSPWCTCTVSCRLRAPRRESEWPSWKKFSHPECTADANVFVTFYRVRLKVMSVLPSIKRCMVLLSPALYVISCWSTHLLMSHHSYVIVMRHFYKLNHGLEMQPACG